MIQLHPEILKKNGKEEFVVLPYEEYVELQEFLEDMKDWLLLQQAKQENAGQPSMSLDEVMKKYGIRE